MIIAPSPRPTKPFDLELINVTKRFGSFVANDKCFAQGPGRDISRAHRRERRGKKHARKVHHGISHGGRG